MVGIGQCDQWNNVIENIVDAITDIANSLVDKEIVTQIIDESVILMLGPLR